MTKANLLLGGLTAIMCLANATSLVLAVLYCTSKMDNPWGTPSEPTNGGVLLILGVLGVVLLNGFVIGWLIEEATD